MSAMDKIETRRRETGAVNGLLIADIALVVLVVIFGSLAIWAYLSYTDQKNNVQSKVDVAVAEAKKAQADDDEQKFAEREKEPNRQFVGPDDYGRLTFNYPKTWSLYVAKDASSGGAYEAYLNPISVPAVSPSTQFALRISIQQSDYDTVIASYSNLVKKGDLRSSTTSSDGNTGTRLDGSFSKDIRGAAVIYKIRDKTVIVRTDAETFKPDFDALVQTIKFNS